jgi:2-polyprenyl-3-methyl-5-hydroxy-6-metoxy-1,4-benzoquinol methylase
MTDKTREYFNQQAPTWENFYAPGGGMCRRKSRFREALHGRLLPESRILDFGCGPGDLSNSLACAGYRVVGVDQAENMITRATQRFSSGRITFQWLGKSNSEPSLPFPDADFDGIICSSVLEYVDDVGSCLRELARACRYGGWLVATVPNLMHPLRAVEKIELFVQSTFARSERTDGGRRGYVALSKNRFPLRGWLRLLADTGWQTAQIAGRTTDLFLIAAQRFDEQCGSAADLCGK